MKTNTIIMILLVVCIEHTTSQQVNWTHHFGSRGIDFCVLTSDNQNNTYVGGWFYQNCYFSSDTLPSTGQNDSFLAKFGQDGELIWAKSIGGQNPFSFNFYEYIENIGGLKYNPVDNCIYLSGNFYSTLTLNNHQIISRGQRDLFLAKFTLDGVCLWIKQAGSQQDDRDGSIGLDEIGNIYWSINLGEPGFIDTNLVSNKSFLSKISSGGEIIWSNPIMSNGLFYRLIVNQDMLYFNAEYSGTISIDTITLISSSSLDYVVGKYDLVNEKIVWLKQITGASMANNISDLLLIGNNIYIYGSFEDSIHIGDTTLSNNNGFADNFILRLDSTGTIKWVYQTHTTDNQYTAPGQLRAGPNNTIYVSGSFRTSCIFGNDTLQGAKQSAFITRFDSTGNFFGTISFGEAINTGLSVLSDGAVVVCGVQTGITEIGDTSFTNFPGELAGYDNYLAKFDAITGMQTISKPKDDKLFIYANPTTGLCNINIPTEFEYEKHLVLYVYDQQGRLLKQTTIEMSEETIKLNMEALAKGMYTAVLSNGKKQFSGKIIFN